eukprot:GILJ01005783.1.p1 GENE.GILJ01005783.1~~GILJ01005783.1.p1  ORF type:complete len:305 (-),score=42.62 GILJ01005783.1:120-1034(-)
MVWCSFRSLASRHAATQWQHAMRSGTPSINMSSSFSVSFSHSAAGKHELVTREDKEKISILTLCNPAKRNALSLEMLTALRSHIIDVTDHSQPKTVIIIQAQGNVFSSGHDLKQLAASTPDEQAKIISLCSNVMTLLREMPQIAIAQVRGLATAAGAQLVASCDLAVADDKASFATPGVKIGLFCTTPGVAIARALPSAKRAMEMLVTGEAMSAQEALRLGFINKVVPADQLEHQTLELAQHIASFSRETLALGKKAFYQQTAKPSLDDAYLVANGVMTCNLGMADAKEGIKAFVEKRHPTWQS